MEASTILDFKSTTLYAIRVVLHTADMPAILDALEQRMDDAAGFFEDEPVVIDASRLSDPLDWGQLVDALKRHGLPTIGVMAPEALLESARLAGLAQVSLPAMPVKSATEESPSTETASRTPAPAAPEPAAAEVVLEPAISTQAPGATATLLIEKPLRSGQKVYARNSDLIVMGVVSHGAEVIADGNIHVYGPLRGKAMAGARGDTAARIYTTQFQAELVAVAGVYRAMTAMLSADIQDKPALIRLDGEKLLVESLAI